MSDNYLMKGVLNYLLKKIDYKISDENNFFIFSRRMKGDENYEKWLKSSKGRYHEGFVDGLEFCKNLVEEMLLLEKNIKKE